MRVEPHERDSWSSKRGLREGATWNDRKKMMVSEPGRGSSPNLELDNTLFLDVPASRTMSNQCLACKPHSLLSSILRAQTDQNTMFLHRCTQNWLLETVRFLWTFFLGMGWCEHRMSVLSQLQRRFRGESATSSLSFHMVACLKTPELGYHSSHFLTKF